MKMTNNIHNRSKKSSYIFKLEIGILLCFCLGLLHFEKYFILLLVFVELAYILVNNAGKANIKMNNTEFLFFAWSVTFLIAYTLFGNSLLNGVVYYLLGPLIITFVCKKSIKVWDVESAIVSIILITSVAYYSHALINVILSIYKNYFVNSSEWVYDVWDKSGINRTIIGVYLTPFTCACIPLALYGEKTYKKILGCSILFLSLLVSVYLGNRSLLLIVATVALIVWIAARKYVNNKMNSFIYLLILILVIILAYCFNVFDIQGFFGSSFLYRRIENNLMDNSRFNVYKEILRYFPDYIFGWMTSRNSNATISLSWAHNVWLDIFVISGIIPFIFFCLYTVSVIRQVKQSFRRINGLTSKLIILSYTIGIMMNWAVEPILDADPYYFASCCAIFATIATFNKTTTESPCA